MSLCCVEISAPRIGDAAWPPGTLSCRLSLPTATLDSEYCCVKGDDPMVSMLIARSSSGKDVKVEKSKVWECVKLPTPSTVHMHPSLLGGGELPDAAGPFDWVSGVAEASGKAETEVGAELVEAALVGAGLDELQLPKAD